MLLRLVELFWNKLQRQKTIAIGVAPQIKRINVSRIKSGAAFWLLFWLLCLADDDGDSSSFSCSLSYFLLAWISLQTRADFLKAIIPSGWPSAHERQHEIIQSLESGRFDSWEVLTCVDAIAQSYSPSCWQARDSEWLWYCTYCYRPSLLLLREKYSEGTLP